MAKRDPRDRIVPFPPARQLMVDGGRLAKRKHVVHGLFEIDVDAPRRTLRAHRARSGAAVSFTAFVIACLGRAVAADRHLHAYRGGRGRLVLFDDVDVTTLVEVERDGRSEIRPTIIRAADKKSVLQIHGELRAFQARAAAATTAAWIDRYGRLPGFVRRALLRFLMADPHRLRARMGTVSLTSLGMLADGGFWGVPAPNHTLQITLGGIARRPLLVDGGIEEHEFLSVTVSFDHDVVDGAPAARFAQRLKELIEGGYGLDRLGQVGSTDPVAPVPATE